MWRGVRNRSNPTVVVLGLLAILAIAGCGSGSGSAPSATTAGSAPISSPGSTSLAPSPSSNLVLPHEDPALEARLPDSVDGNTLFKLSVGPVSSVGNEGAEPVKKLASEIGDGTGNFGLAFANDPTATADPFNYFALRIPGAPTRATRRPVRRPYRRGHARRRIGAGDDGGQAGHSRHGAR